MVRWVHGEVPLDHFIGRDEELARLDRWTADPEVRLLGVTAWGGAGKTALVSEWLDRHSPSRPVRGVFGWSFYADPSAERWADALLTWAKQTFGYSPGVIRRLSAKVLDLAKQVPLLLVLDGLEVIQEVPAQHDFGRFLDDLLRAVLTEFCQRDHGSLAVLTSRFPFADLESFDGVAARMLDVPPFTLAEGADLLDRAGGGWLPEPERLSLVSAVDGHALAVGVLATALRDRSPVHDMVGLRQALESAERTDTRVGKVLQFYAERLSNPERMLIAIVSLFTRPVPVSVVLTLGDSEALGRYLAGWTAGQVEADVRGPLAGLLTWHPDATISVRPLVRSHFRPLVLTGDTARLASDIALADLPAMPIFSRDEALRVVEVIELLLEAGEWAAADNLHLGRTDRGTNWARIPATRLGQRCAMAFVGTESRRRACRRELGAEHLARYINHAALFATLSGDMITAEFFLELALEPHNEIGETWHGRILSLQRLSWCLYYQGYASRAQDAAQQAVTRTRAGGPYTLRRNVRTTLGAALDLAGESMAADKCFIQADALQRGHESAHHIFGHGGTLWGDLLLRTERIAVARKLTEENLVICEGNQWNHGIARCERLLGRCDLAEGDLRSAEPRLDNAVTTFRDGEFLVELAMTLPDLAEQRRLTGDLDTAEHLCTETVNIAGPRQLVTSHAQALAVRARVRADRLVTSGATDLGNRARDDADHALRLSTMIRHLPWQELSALDAHAYIDIAEKVDRGWSRKADELRSRLNPPGLRADPLLVTDWPTG